MKMRISFFVALAALMMLVVGCGPKIVGTGTVITKPRTVLAFQEVKVTSQLTVNFVQAEEAGVEITADDNLHPYINTSVQKGVLSLSLDEPIKSFSKLQVTVKAPTLGRIEGGGEAKLNTQAWKQDDLEISIYDECQARMQLQVKTLKISGAGQTRFAGKGQADRLTIKARDEAQLNLAEYKVNTADVVATDNAVVTVNVDKVLNVTASGDAEIIKQGSAKLKRSEISGSATISTP